MHRQQTVFSKQLKAPPRRFGQALVEFALIFPILVLVSYGLIELGRFMFVYAAANTAVREASRYAASAGNNDEGVPYYQDCKGIREIATRLAFFTTDQNVQIQYDHGTASQPISDCPSNVDRSSVQLEAGDRVHVTLSVKYHPFFLFSTDEVDLSFDSAHTIVKNVVISDSGAGGSGSSGSGGSGSGGSGSGAATSTPTPTPSPTPTSTPTPTPTPTPMPTPTPTPCHGWFCW